MKHFLQKQSANLLAQIEFDENKILINNFLGKILTVMPHD
tara:strand:- start:2096 stop:2215 length:120 start_codon:yes stop_codon:yes gene_type:complete